MKHCPHTFLYDLKNSFLFYFEVFVKSSMCPLIAPVSCLALCVLVLLSYLLHVSWFFVENWTFLDNILYNLGY